LGSTWGNAGRHGGAPLITRTEEARGARSIAAQLDHHEWLGLGAGHIERVQPVAERRVGLRVQVATAVEGEADRGSRQLRRHLTDGPELRHTEAGIARAMFRVAVSGRREQEASFFTVIVWRDQAEHAAQSIARGSRVVVVGRLQQRSWTAEDGSARSVVEVVAEELSAFRSVVPNPSSECGLR
jgi:single-strand DNA-binding protein